jgi:HEAT repeat protein
LRRAAAAALAKQAKDAKSAWPAIKSALNDSDQAVRYQLIRLCGQIGKEFDEVGGEVAAAIINAALKDGNVEIRLAAVQELADLPSADGRINEVLDELSSNDPIAAIRDAAEAAQKKRRGPPRGLGGN